MKKKMWFTMVVSVIASLMLAACAAPAAAPAPAATVPSAATAVVAAQDTEILEMKELLG